MTNRNIASLTRNKGSFANGGHGIGYVADTVSTIIPKLYPLKLEQINTKIGKWNIIYRNQPGSTLILQDSPDFPNIFCALYYNEDNPLRPRTLFCGADLNRDAIRLTAQILSKHVLETGHWQPTEGPTYYTPPSPFITADYVRPRALRLWGGKPEYAGLKADLERVKSLPQPALFYLYGPEAEAIIIKEHDTMARERQTLYGQLNESMEGDDDALSEADFTRVYESMQHIGKERLQLLRKLRNFNIPLEDILSAFDPLTQGIGQS